MPVSSDFYLGLLISKKTFPDISLRLFSGTERCVFNLQSGSVLVADGFIPKRQVQKIQWCGNRNV